MKHGLMRPAAALFPAVLLAASLLGGNSIASALFLCWCVVQLFSLCSVDSFRNAAAREPGVRRVDRRFSGSWPMILLGVLLAGGIGGYYIGWESFRNTMLAFILSAGCITIEQVFEERMYALSRSVDGAVLSIISGILLLVGMLVDASGSMPMAMEGFFTLCASALGMVISIIASYAIEPMHAFSLLPRNIAFFPKAAVQCLLYPAAGITLIGINVISDGTLSGANSSYSMLFCGMILWRLARTVCRRAGDESRPLNLLLAGVCAALLVAGIWIPALADYALNAAAALICALIVFCAPGWRIYTGSALMIGACLLQMRNILPDIWNKTAVIACCAAAVILNLHKAFLRKI